jgi:hypothetical protein
MNHGTNIPVFLCGTHAAVRRSCTKIAKLAIKLKSIEQAVESEEFIDIDDAPGHLIFQGPTQLAVAENVILYPFWRDLFDLVDPNDVDRENYYQQTKSLVLPALDHFWRSLAFLADHPEFPLGTSYDQERTEVSTQILTKLLRWWPAFQRLEDRFYGGYGITYEGYKWGRATWGPARDLGADTAFIRHMQTVDTEDAADMLKELIRRSKTTGSS